MSLIGREYEYRMDLSLAVVRKVMADALTAKPDFVKGKLRS
jgi:hypothetical protein